MLDDRFRLALHESGHAVAALHVGASVQEVSIIPDHDTNGRAVVRYSRDQFRTAMQNTIISLAGRAAVLFHESGDVAGVRKEISRLTSTDQSSDFVNHRNAVKYAESNQRTRVRYSKQKIQSGAIAQAVAIIKRRWSAIELIAKELHRYKKLSSTRVEFLYSQAKWAEALVPAVDPK